MKPTRFEALQQALYDEVDDETADKILERAEDIRTRHV
jgi:hypothetical protein